MLQRSSLCIQESSSSSFLLRHRELRVRMDVFGGEDGRLGSGKAAARMGCVWLGRMVYEF